MRNSGGPEEGEAVSVGAKGDRRLRVALIRVALIRGKFGENNH